MDTRIRIPSFAYIRKWEGVPPIRLRPRRIEVGNNIDANGVSFVVGRRDLIGRMFGYRILVSHAEFNGRTREERMELYRTWTQRAIARALSAGI